MHAENVANEGHGASRGSEAREENEGLREKGEP